MWCLRHTPELWRGAAGLCARVRARAGAAESLNTCAYSVYKKIATRDWGRNAGVASQEYGARAQGDVGHALSLQLYNSGVTPQV